MKPFVSLLACVVFTFFALNASANLRSIAEIGAPAADFPADFIYWSVENPVIGGGGHVAFTGAADVSIGSTLQNTNAVWYGKPGQLKTAIKEGGSPAGFAANTLFHFSIAAPTVSDSGSVAFTASMTGPNASVAHLATVNGTTHGIVQQGGIAPQFPPGSIIGGLGGFVFSDAGMAFSGTAVGQGPAKIAVWFWNNATVELVATTGTEFTTLYPGCDILSLQIADLNQAGELLFYASLNSQGMATCPFWGLFTWKAGVFRKVVVQGEPASGMPAGSTFSLLALQGLGTSINDNGDVAFQAIVRDALPANHSIAWVAYANGELAPVALDGEAVPASPSELIRLLANAIPATNADTTAVLKIHSTTAADMILVGPPKQGANYSDFANPGESHLQLLVRSDAQPPGFDPSWHLSDMSQPLINNQGSVAFTAVAKDALNPNTSATPGIWLGDSAANLRLLVATGKPVLIDGQPDELSQILPIIHSNISARSSNSGLPIQFNDRGQLIFRATRLGDGFPGTLLMGMAATPECSGMVVTIPARTYADGEVIYCVGEQSLSTDSTVTVRVSSGADVTYESPALCLDKGFSVAKGGVFSAITP